MRAILATMLLLSGCAPARPAAVPPAAPVPAPCEDAPDVGDLTGSWMTGTAGDPPPLREVVIHRECAHHPAAWIVEQADAEIRAWQFPASMEQGIARKEPVQRVEPDVGRICGREIIFADGSRLRWDPETAHLRGMRDGKPFWAVRQRVMGPSPCPGVP